MVSGLLIIALILISSPVWGEPSRQMCLSCHPPHHTERGGCPDCHRGNPASGRKNIAHASLVSGKYAFHALGDSLQVQKGNRLIDQYACRRCHVIGERGNRLAMSLDRAAGSKPPVELAESIKRPVDAMPDFGLDDERIAFMVNSILADSRGSKVERGGPVVVHFSNHPKRNRDVFTIKCGSCHRMISKKRGVLGTGDVGPNLSGFLSAYYPKTFRKKRAWTFQHLISWLKNPREIRLWAAMRPISLTDDELKELESLFEIAVEIPK